MVRATDNEGMWEGLRITERTGRLTHLAFSQIKDTNGLNGGNITNHSQISCWTTEVGLHRDHKSGLSKHNKAARKRKAAQLKTVMQDIKKQ